MVGKKNERDNKTLILIEESNCLIFFNIRSYQCMYMCINVPWKFEIILPDGYPR